MPARLKNPTAVRPSPEELTRLYAAFTSNEIAAQLGVDPSTVRSWLRATGIQMRPSGSPAPTPKPPCLNCGGEVGHQGSYGRCARCSSYWQRHKSERPDNHQNPRYHACPYTHRELYELYWRQEVSAQGIGARQSPPVSPKVVIRWLDNAGVLTRTRDRINQITAQKHGAQSAVRMRERLSEKRLAGLVTSNASQMHTPEARAKVVAANKARAKAPQQDPSGETNRRRSRGGVSRSYGEIMDTLTRRQREQALDGKSGFNRLRALKKL